MATVIQIQEDKYERIKHYTEKALDHSRMVEHILTEIEEKLHSNLD